MKIEELKSLIIESQLSLTALRKIRALVDAEIRIKENAKD